MSNAAGIKAGRAYVEVGGDDSPLKKVLAGVEGRLRSLGGILNTVGSSLLGAGAGLGAPILAAVKSFSDAGSLLDDMAQRTGASVESLSELQYAFQQSGTDSAALEAGLIKVNKLLGDASNGEKGATDALSELGTSFEALQSLSPDQQFETIVSKLGEIEDIGRRTTVAMAVFGKSGASLLPLVGQIDELRSKARELGLTMSGEDAAAAAAFGDAMDNLGSGIQGIVNKIGASLAPALTTAGESLAALSKPIGDWLAANDELVIGVGIFAAALGAAGVVVLSFGMASTVAAVAVGGLGTVVAAVLSPIGLMTAAVSGLGYLIVTQTEMGEAAFEGLLDSAWAIVGPIMDAFSGIVDAVRSGDLELAGQIAMKGLEVAWRAGLEVLSDSWDSTVVYLEGALDQFQTTASQVWLTITDNLAGAFDSAYLTVQKILNKLASDVAKTVVDGKVQLNLITTREGDLQKEGIDFQQQAADAIAKGNFKGNADTRNKITDGAREALIEDANKRAKDRQGRLDSLGGDSAQLATAKAELQALIAQAEKEKNIAITPDQQKRGQAAVDATRTIVESKGAAGAAFGSSSAASSIARAANGTGMSQLIAESKRQTEALKRLESAVKTQPVIEVTEVDN